MTPPVFLVARREYLAYVGAWGFWASLLTAPLLLAALIFAPLLLARAEPPRALVVLADRPSDAARVLAAYEERARTDARNEIFAFLSAAAPAEKDAALAAFDAAPNRAAALAAARAHVAQAAPRALGAFPDPSPRYSVVAAPAPDIEALRPHLSGEQSLPDGAGLFGALNIRRDSEGAPLIEYWSVNLQHSEPADMARGVMRREMQREALAARGVSSEEADALDALEPQIAQFDPRPGASTGAVTAREQAPFIAAAGFAFVLWMFVFSIASMLLSSVIEEKSNKILDTLLTSVTPLEILIGKLLGVAAVSATLLLFWGALGGGLLGAAAAQMGNSTMGQAAASILESKLALIFVLGFVAGYLMYGAIFLGLGALCDSVQEAQTLLGPVTFLLMLPMLLIGPALDNPNAPIIEAASWFPLFTPFLMVMRAPAGLSGAELAGMCALMAATIAVLLTLATRVFRAGVVNQLSVASLFRRRRGVR